MLNAESSQRPGCVVAPSPLYLGINPYFWIIYSYKILQNLWDY
jgi:hypothetical protein